MCIDTCVGMCIDMCTDMCIDMRVGMKSPVSVSAALPHVYGRAIMLTDTCRDMCTDMRSVMSPDGVARMRMCASQGMKFTAWLKAHGPSAIGDGSWPCMMAYGLWPIP